MAITCFKLHLEITPPPKKKFTSKKMDRRKYLGAGLERRAVRIRLPAVPRVAGSLWTLLRHVTPLLCSWVGRVTGALGRNPDSLVPWRYVSGNPKQKPQAPRGTLPISAVVGTLENLTEAGTRVQAECVTNIWPFRDRVHLSECRNGATTVNSEITSHRYQGHLCGPMASGEIDSRTQEQVSSLKVKRRR